MSRGSAFFVALIACSGADSGAPRTPGPTTKPAAPAPAATADPRYPALPGLTATPSAPIKAKPTHKPESFLPAWTRVGVGQTISFGVAAIDQDLDETATEVTTMPASAAFDPITQTVTWTPTTADLTAGTGTFVVTIKQADQPGGGWNHTEQVTYDIAVDAKQQPAPIAAPQSAVVETVLTIRDPARLAAVNRDWPIDRMLVHAADLHRATLPPELQLKLGPNQPEDLYNSFLAGLAVTHANPRLDPDSDAFDRAAFGTAAAWTIVAIRPRIDRQWNELRVVYQATAAHEPVFAMFRLRPTWDVPTVPPEARAANNQVFAALVAKHLLDKQLGPSAKLMKNAKTDGKAIAAFVRAVVTYVPPAPKRGQPAPPPWQRAAFVALWTGARMGGGSARTSDGAYRSGDGWAWAVMKPTANAAATAQAYVDVAMPGVWTQAIASADGTAWVPACAPDNAQCRKPLGLVDPPDATGGKVTTAKRDATNLWLEFKRGDAVARLALDDGRRDVGEDSGMTCAQCHTRAFGVRDYGDAATVDPSAGVPAIGNAPLATTSFQIVPSPTAPAWTAYTLELMADQECKAKANLEKSLGRTSALTCPLAP